MRTQELAQCLWSRLGGYSNRLPNTARWKWALFEPIKKLDESQQRRLENKLRDGSTYGSAAVTAVREFREVHAVAKALNDEYMKSMHEDANGRPAER